MGVGRGRGPNLGLAFALAVVAVPAIARAEVDWAKGLVTADGIGIANRAAPSPAAARGPARRLAEDAAKRRLAAQLPALPLAGGGTLEAKLADPAVKAAIDRAVASALTLDAEPQTDGSWNVSMAVPIEAIRQAVADPRGARPFDQDAGPAVVVVEGAKAAPAVGYRLGSLSAATLFVAAVPAWAKDAPRVKAKGTGAGVIDVAPGKATPATLFVIITQP